MIENKNFVLAITSPAGSGKSTVAGKLAKQIEQCVNIDADHVKHFIVNGFVYGETPAGIKQWELLGDNIGLLARNFLETGYHVIINGFINEPAWKNIQQHIELTHKILLLPHIDTIISRDSERIEDYVMGEAMVKNHHDYFSNNGFYGDFIKLDTTDDAVDETISKIMTHIRSSI